LLGPALAPERLMFRWQTLRIFEQKASVCGRVYPAIDTEVATIINMHKIKAVSAAQKVQKF